MRAILGLVLLLVGVSGVAFARICPYGNCAVPEMDPDLAGSGLALLAGGVLMILSRRRK
jgi:hypothetical protein